MVVCLGSLFNFYFCRSHAGAHAQDRLGSLFNFYFCRSRMQARMHKSLGSLFNFYFCRCCFFCEFFMV